jgi:hypothetical protein
MKVLVVISALWAIAEGKPTATPQWRSNQDRD